MMGDMELRRQNKEHYPYFVIQEEEEV